MEHLSAKEQELWNELWNFYCKVVEERHKGDPDYEPTISECLADMTSCLKELTRKQIRPLANRSDLPASVRQVRAWWRYASLFLGKALDAFYDAANDEMDQPL